METPKILTRSERQAIYIDNWVQNSQNGDCLFVFETTRWGKRRFDNSPAINGSDQVHIFTNRFGEILKHTRPADKSDWGWISRSIIDDKRCSGTLEEPPRTFEP